jgi:hypothetical protein
LTLQGVDVRRVPEGAETWEKVIRKVRTGAMPPVGAPRPDGSTSNALATWLETELDRTAAASPEPGKLPHFHRLTRFEYQNAIRDLLALETLPKDMDYSVLLPSDNASSGFDNLADLLFVSPAIMERYLDAARKISRVAVGDPSMPMIVSSYRLSGTRPQDVRLYPLPVGTRGGIAVNGEFPLDGEYLVRVEMSGQVREAHQIEVTVDGERLHVFDVSPGRGGRGRGAPPPSPDQDPGGSDPVPPDASEPPAGRGGRQAGTGPQGAAGGRGGARNNLETRIPIKASTRLVGVTFIERTEAIGEETVRPRMRGRGSLPAMANVTISGPIGAGRPGDTASRKRIFVCKPTGVSTELPCAKQILSTLARRAYRRPVIDADMQDLLPFYTSGRDEAGFETGIQRAIERLLVSPQFLYRIEQDPPRATAGATFRISDLELASRLSFFLWSSIPDDELLQVAARGQLKELAVLEQQVRRMLADAKSQTLVSNFAAQWLYLRDVDSRQPDELIFPDFDDSLRQALRTETELFLTSVLRSDRSVLELLTANYTFLNERLADHYRIPHIKGSHFRRVEFPPGSPRGGLLGQGSILTLTSYATRTSPVLRGKWVLDNILATPPPPPPPNVPALKVEHEAGKPSSVRDAMVQHRANPVCASCHARMDPIGFAMENFDAVGRWRDHESPGQRIDSSGSFPDGTKFTGIADLKQMLASRPDQFVTTITEKLLMYAIARNVQYYDAPAVRAIVRNAKGSHYTFESLVLGVTKSAPFQMRKVEVSGQSAVDGRQPAHADARYTSSREVLDVRPQTGSSPADLLARPGGHVGAAAAGLDGTRALGTSHRAG